MSVKEIECKIKSTSPLLMHAYQMDKIDGFEKKPAKEQAEYAAYRDPQTRELYIPGPNFLRAMVSAAIFSKGKGRASLQKPVAACVLVTAARIGLGTTEYAIDSRRVVMPTTKGSVTRHRPRLDQWSVSLKIEFEDCLLKESEVRQIVDNVGLRVGLLDFRPEKKGPFGRFMVTNWKLL